MACPQDRPSLLADRPSRAPRDERRLPVPGPAVHARPGRREVTPALPHRVQDPAGSRFGAGQESDHDRRPSCPRPALRGRAGDPAGAAARLRGAADLVELRDAGRPARSVDEARPVRATRQDPEGSAWTAPWGKIRSHLLSLVGQQRVAPGGGVNLGLSRCSAASRRAASSGSSRGATDLRDDRRGGRSRRPRLPRLPPGPAGAAGRPEPHARRTGPLAGAQERPEPDRVARESDPPPPLGRPRDSDLGSGLAAADRRAAGNLAPGPLRIARHPDRAGPRRGGRCLGGGGPGDHRREDLGQVEGLPGGLAIGCH